MAKYVGSPYRHGIVVHNLDSEDVSVTLWRLNEDGTRSLVQAAVDVLTPDMIKVDIVATNMAAGCTHTIKDGKKYVVVVRS